MFDIIPTIIKKNTSELKEYLGFLGYKIGNQGEIKTL